MNASTFATEHQPAVDPFLAIRTASSHLPFHEDASFSQRLDVIPGMLASMDSLSMAGQRYVMDKVVSFMEQQTDRAQGLSLPNQHMFAELIAEVRRESERMVPGVPLFIRRAESLLTLLSATS